MTSCRDVMTKDPLCCLPSDTVDQVAQAMRREDIGAVPVVASHETKRLIGIVTDRDLALRVVAEGRDNHRTRVEAVLTPSPWVCHLNDSLDHALDMLVEKQIRRILVVDDEDAVVGIIAQADVDVN